MKYLHKLFLTCAVLMIAGATSRLSAQVNVTFQVDMSEQIVDAAGVHIAGSFQGWDPAGTPLTDMGGGIWSTIAVLNASESIEYKFINGNAWGLDETVPAECGTGGNRVHVVGASDEILPAYCYGSCNICAPPVSDLTFSVDMSNEVVDGTGVFIAGSFQGWDPAASPLIDMGSGVWEITVSLEEGSSYEYKFLNGSDFAGAESVPAACEVNTNRGITVGVGGSIEPTVCFGLCTACLAGVPGCTDSSAQNYDPSATTDDGSCAYLVTLEVDMNNVCVSPDGVHIAGSFQGWDAAATLVEDIDLDGVYTYETTLANGDYEYKFINGNAFGQDELIPVECAVNGNRGISVSGANVTVPVHCFASCTVCAAPADAVVTVQVNMSEQVVDAAGVYVMGTFNGWDPTTDALTDLGGGLWSADITVPSGTALEYRFVNGNTTGGSESVPVECGQDSGNGLARFIDCVDGDQTIDPICFGACSACLSSLVNVTFQVDMSNETLNPIGVFIVGTFQDPPFTAGLDQMTDVGAGVWEFTVAIAAGTAVEYKYLNGPNFANEETVPQNCGVDNGFGGYNRNWTVGASDETVPLHCFSSCNSCDTAPVNVTFQVDMSQEVVDAAGVHIAGAFQGWDPAATMMTDQGGGIWTYTTALNPGETVEYKYVNGNAWGLDESVPAECASGFNRFYTPGSTDETVPVVCFGSCTSCLVGVPGCLDLDAVNYDPLATVDDGSCQYNVSFSVNMNQYVGTFTTVYVSGTFNGWCADCNPLDDADLDGIWSATFPTMNGDHEYKFQVDQWADSEQFDGSETCTYSENGIDFNRGLLSITGDTTVPVVCWEACGACPSVFYNIVFRVDMSNQTVDANGPHIVGDFQGFDPAASPMTYLGYGIYEYSILLAEEQTYQYRYLNGNDFANSEVVPVECGVDNGLGEFNRTVTATSDMVLSVVCFNECAACSGCTDPFSVEYNPFAGDDDGSCATQVVAGCTYPDADNYMGSATTDDGSCLFTTGSACPEDLNSDGLVNASDLLQFLAAFGSTCL